MGKISLSVVLATKNEEKNIGRCLASVKDIADEIIVYDEYSTDNTREVARRFGAKVYKYLHKKNFHETKQKAIDKASGEWILQLDADEVVGRGLASEIRRVIRMTNRQILDYLDLQKQKKRKPWRLFERHQRLVEQKEGSLGRKSGEITAFFIPRINFFLNKPLRYAGVYPDAVIRLFKRGKAYLPGKSVHELMKVDGEIGWLFEDLRHYESPTFSRYLERMNRYTDFHAEELNQGKAFLSYWNLFKYSFLIPLRIFFLLYVRHKGFRDGMRGFVWSLFSSLHYPIAFFKYWQINRSEG